MADSLSTTVDQQEQVVSSMRSVITDAEDVLAATADQSGEAIANLRVRVQARLKDARLRLAEAEASLVAKTRAAAKATDVYVHESPWTAVGIAAGIGLLVGLIIGRR